ncbi:YceI family protein [Aureitalea sp. L0-47]|uniref:YceI family protein n=1 Tax=Aureitalea sp. L0-47 TaxID=2816962 RepID=UPI0022384F2C|nr:YceI family protein [Aureitalea sp. L0-47]MCW5519703.1 YceI family protein [Aureitalea sp. L0-47]
MKKIFFLISALVLILGPLHAQEKLKTKSGTITFEASVPSFEEVKATHQNVSAILNTSNGEFAALALVKGFRFKVALMEEHFNENYMESSTYPKAVFKGIIADFDIEDLKDKPSKYTIKGSITLHGETRDLNEPVQIWKEEDKIVVTTNFKLNPEDFNIKIPAVVSKKIAEDVDVAAKFNLQN